MNKLCRQYYLQLRIIYPIRTQLPRFQAAKATSSFYLSCLDYSIFVHRGRNQVFLDKLHRIQNAAARFFTGPWPIGSQKQPGLLASISPGSSL